MTDKYINFVDWLRQWFYNKDEVDDFVGSEIGGHYGTFEELQKLIDNANDGGTITLKKDYINVNHSLGRAKVGEESYITSDYFGLIIPKTLTIDGGGHTIDGDNFKGIFNVPSPSSTIPDITVTIKNCKIINSTYGGLYGNGQDLSFENCTFVNHNVSELSLDSGDAGAPIFSWVGGKSLSVNNCRFFYNKGQWASAIYSVNSSYANISITNCVFLTDDNENDNNPIRGNYLWSMNLSNNIDYNFMVSSTDWKEISYSSGYKAYGTNNGLYYRRVGNIVELSGVWTSNSKRTSSNTEVEFGRINSLFAPSKIVRVRCQGTGLNTYLLTINTEGVLYWARYGTTGNTDLTSGFWGTVHITWTIDKNESMWAVRD